MGHLTACSVALMRLYPPLLPQPVAAAHGCSLLKGHTAAMILGQRRRAESFSLTSAALSRTVPLMGIDENALRFLEDDHESRPPIVGGAKARLNTSTSDQASGDQASGDQAFSERAKSAIRVGDLRRSPTDVEDRLPPATPEAFVCLTCAHYVEFGHDDRNAAPDPAINIHRLCRAIQYEEGWLDMTDEGIAYCSMYRPRLSSGVVGVVAWMRNRKRLRDAQRTMRERTDEGK